MSQSGPRAPLQAPIRCEQKPKRQLRYNRDVICWKDGPPMGSATARFVLTTLLVLISTVFTACHAGSNEGRMHAAADPASILLFNGTGASPGDGAALEKILSNEHLNYSAVDSSRLNGMSESQIREYRLLIVPGGNFEDLGNSLTSSAAANIRNAIQNG